MKPRIRDLWSAGPDYRRFAAATIFTSVGSGMQFVAMSWYLYKITGSAASIGWALIAATLPGILFSPWIGTLVDRYNSRTICVVTDLLRATVLLIVALGMQVFSLHAGWIYAAFFMLAVCENFFSPASGALVRDIVAPANLLNANAVANVSMQIGALVGASLGGMLVGLTGAPLVIAFDGVSFLVSAYLTLRIAILRYELNAASASGASFRDEFRQTVFYIRGNRFILRIAFVQALLYITLYVCNTLLPAFVDRALHGGAASFGLIDAAWGAGAIVGGLSMSYLFAKQLATNTARVGLLIIAASLLLFLTSRHAFQAVVAYFLLGLVICNLRLSTDTALAADVPPAYFGKVKATITMIISWAGIGVYALVGYAGDHIGIRLLYLSLCLLVLGGSFAGLLGGAVASPADSRFQSPLNDRPGAP